MSTSPSDPTQTPPAALQDASLACQSGIDFGPFSKDSPAGRLMVWLWTQIAAQLAREQAMTPEELERERFEDKEVLEAWEWVEREKIEMMEHLEKDYWIESQDQEGGGGHE